jgi:hypothetical protein
MDYTFTAAQTDAAAAAFRSAIELLAVTIPGSFVETGPNGTLPPTPSWLFTESSNSVMPAPGRR